MITFACPGIKFSQKIWNKIVSFSANLLQKRWKEWCHWSTTKQLWNCDMTTIMTVVVKLVLQFDRFDHWHTFPFSFLLIATSQVTSCNKWYSICTILVIKPKTCFRSDLNILFFFVIWMTAASAHRLFAKLLHQKKLQNKVSFAVIWTQRNSQLILHCISYVIFDPASGATNCACL